MTLFVRSGGQRGAHQWVRSADNIAKVSNIGVQVFQWHVKRRFRRTRSNSTASIFALVPSHNVLCVFSPNSKPTPIRSDILEVEDHDHQVFELLLKEKRHISAAIKKLSARKRRGVVDSEDSDGE